MTRIAGTIEWLAVLVVDDAEVGFAWFVPEGETVKMELICVDGSRKNRKYGGTVDQCIHHFHGMGYKFMSLERHGAHRLVPQAGVPARDARRPGVGRGWRVAAVAIGEHTHNLYEIIMRRRKKPNAPWPTRGCAS